VHKQASARLERPSEIACRRVIVFDVFEHIECSDEVVGVGWEIGKRCSFESHAVGVPGREGGTAGGDGVTVDVYGGDRSGRISVGKPINKRCVFGASVKDGPRAEP
jgi:hypothetical protein